MHLVSLCLGIVSLSMFSKFTQTFAKAAFTKQSAGKQAGRLLSNLKLTRPVFANRMLRSASVAAGVTMLAYSTAAPATEAEASEPADKFTGTAMFPPIKPYEKGMLKVSDIHTIAYSCYGNPKGKPVLFVHGGPGGGTDPGKVNNFVSHHFINFCSHGSLF